MKVVLRYKCRRCECIHDKALEIDGDRERVAATLHALATGPQGVNVCRCRDSAWRPAGMGVADLIGLEFPEPEE